MRKSLFTLLLCLGVTFISFAQKERVHIDFAKGLEKIHIKKLFETYSGTTTEIKPENNGYTYSVTKGANIRMLVTAAEGYVDYLWFEGAGNQEREIRKSYNKKEYTIENITASQTTIRVDCRELIPVTFIAPKEGSYGKAVLIDEQDDYGTEIKPTEPGGDIYMLPKNGSVYFDSAVDKEHFVLCWLLDGNIFPSKPDIFYKQNIPLDMHIEVRFYKSGETRTITYTQPKTAVIKCVDRGTYGSPEIESGATVDPGNEILFEIAPPNNPAGKVILHHWIINGKPYKRGNKFFTDNSLSIYAFENLEVSAVPMEEYQAPDIKINFTPDIVDFESVAVGKKVIKEITVSTKNATEEILFKLRDALPSLTLSPKKLPAEGGKLTLTYKPSNAREIIDTKLLCATGETTASISVKARSVTEIENINKESFPFILTTNSLIWRQNTEAKIYTLEGILVASGSFVKGSKTHLTSTKNYIVVTKERAIKILIP